jgi:hypothetical protein
MARTHSSIATDSEEALRDIVGPDATAGFEDDPKFIDADPTSTASSDNVAVQRDTDDLEDSEEEELESEEDEDDVDDVDDEDEDVDEDEEDEEVDDEAEAALQTKTFDDLGEEDDDAGDVEAGLDEDTLDEDDLDTDRVTDAALSLDPVLRMAAAMRMAPSTSARSASHR